MLRFFSLLFFLSCTLSVFSQVKVGDNPSQININSLLELESSDKVFVLSRMSSDQMNAIAPLNGALVYNTDEKCVFLYDDTNWKSLCNAVSDYQQLSFDSNTNILTLENGGAVDLSSLDSEGEVGPEGPEGPAGAQGIQGEVGPIGLTGPAGNDGLDGAQGIQGEIGPQGIPGSDGADGLNGTNGTNGDSAYQIAVTNGFVGSEADWLASLDGVDGTDGLDGAQGIQGEIGPQGIPGNDGANGLDGADGAQGIQGEIGPQGIQGEVGPIGLTGPAGNDGTNGTNGSDGDSAYQIAVTNGFVGSEADWLASLDGVDGTDGLDGAQGIQGEVGPIGLTGPAGNDGTNGTNGADGDSAYQIAVANGFIGSETDWLASLDGVDGAQGIQGEVGPQGEQGIQGEVGPIGLTGPAGNDGTNGTNGTNGDSAYQIAVTNGFVGSEADWLASLDGADGAQGIQGEVGPIGLTGPAGNDGVDGLDGAQGIQGEIGPQGIPGNNGADGLDGTNGADGDSAYQIAVTNGFIGSETDWLASLEGVDGAQGIQGEQGEQGIQGEMGPQGIQGEKGDAGAGATVTTATTAPTTNVEGDTWIDNSTARNVINIWDGAAWVPINNNPKSSAGPPTPANAQNPLTGDIYVDETNGDIYTFNGTDWFNNSNSNKTTANNGITKTTDNIIQLGGALVQPTEITTDATNTLAIQGIENAAVSDDTDIVVVDKTTGVLKKMEPSNLLREDEIIVIATDGQLQFTAPQPITDATKIDVYRNGVRISFTALNNTTIELELAAICYQNDEIRIVQLY